MNAAAFQWIVRHGYAGIFSLLALGIVGLPVPDEWLLTFSGYLVFRGTLRFVPAFGAAFVGSVCGITLSYTLGRMFDTCVLVKYGSALHLSHEKMARVHSWFEKRGGWALLFGYFVPGVRHLTGYAAGASKMSSRRFTVFACSGAFCWTGVFLVLGYVLGEEWNRVLQELHQTKGIIVVAGALVFAGYVIVALMRRFIRGSLTYR
jgi:membrane protein DedA with SNARE-associated domain